MCLSPPAGLHSDGGFRMEHILINYAKAQKWSGKKDVEIGCGIYAIFLESMDKVPETWRPDLERDDKLIYIGVAKKNLANRLYYHFSGSSAQSTLRRSAGAMMRDELQLGRCRRNPKSKHFRFENEKPLSNWFQQYCRFVYICGKDAYDAEAELISRLKPPFNNDKNPKVHPLLKAALKDCEKAALKA